jgi:alpha-D-ribose 1-methylphosphonate 5-triphosphate synthase subunit PhnH
MSEVHELHKPAVAAQMFRKILDGLSRPGTEQTIEAVDEVPAKLGAATAAIALTLCDYQSPIWLSPAIDTDEVRKFLRFHTGAPITSDKATSVFALMSMAEACKSFDGFALGTHEYPDRSTTLVVQSEGFEDKLGVELSGPGIKTPRSVAVAGATQSFWQNVVLNNSSFPLGCDFIFTCGEKIMGLPRSTRVKLPGER